MHYVLLWTFRICKFEYMKGLHSRETGERYKIITEYKTIIFDHLQQLSENGLFRMKQYDAYVVSYRIKMFMMWVHE